MISAESFDLTLSSPSGPAANSLRGVGTGLLLRCLGTWTIPWFCDCTAGFCSVKERFTITVSSIWVPETHQEIRDFTCVLQLGAAKRASDKITASCFYPSKGLTRVCFLFMCCCSSQNTSSRSSQQIGVGRLEAKAVGSLAYHWCHLCFERGGGWVLHLEVLSNLY